MKFAVYLPPAVVDQKKKCPVLYYLSGLTCSYQYVIAESGFQRVASELNLIVVCPDTSPRNVVPGEDDSFDFGSAASFYLDATQPPWSGHYKMYTYVTKELQDLIERNFPVTAKRSIMGHSMGGHGALICALKNPQRYCSLSLLAPVCHATENPFGKKCFTGYLGSSTSDEAKAYDALEIMKKATKPFFTTPILLDQGTEDEFLPYLFFNDFEKACNKCGQKINLRMHQGYDHNYFFIATFIEEHLRHHAKYLA